MKERIERNEYDIYYARTDHDVSTVTALNITEAGTHTDSNKISSFHINPHKLVKYTEISDHAKTVNKQRRIWEESQEKKYCFH